MFTSFDNNHILLIGTKYIYKIKVLEEYKVIKLNILKI